MSDAQTRNYALLLLGWVTLYLCQRTVPSTASHLQTSASFSLEDVSKLLSCFALTYALTKLASGFLYDGLGLSPKLLFCWGLGAGGLLCVLFPAAASTGLPLTCLLWMLVGVFHGFGWPACAQMTKQWYRPSELGKRYAVLSAASNVATGTAPVLSVYMATTVGWQSVYYLLGTTSLIFSTVLMVGMEYQPQKRKESLNKCYTSHREGKEVTETYSWWSVFLFKEFWLVTVLSATAWTVKASVFDWMLLYVSQQLNHSHFTGMHLPL